MLKMLSKKILFIWVLLALSSCAFAQNYAAETDQGIYAPGPYAGVRFGWSNVSTSGFKNFLKTQGDFSEKQHWEASQLILGWSFWRFLSLEGGYTDFPDKEYHLTLNPNTEYKYIDETKSWDIVAKLSLPLSVIADFLKRVDIYGKGGIAYVSGSLSWTINDDDKDNKTTHAWLPFYELGIDYNFNKYFSASLSWTRINGKNKLKYGLDANNEIFVDNKDVIPTTNFFAIGVSFKMANLL